MFKHFRLHQVLFACFAAVAVVPGVLAGIWGMIVAGPDESTEIVERLFILLASSLVAVVVGWALSRRVAEHLETLQLRQHEFAHAMRLAVMGETASAIAHEINQPLAAIAAYIDGSLKRLKAGDPASADILDALDKAAEQTRRAGTVLRRIRTFVHEAELGRTFIDLNKPIRDGLDLVVSEAHLAGVQIETDLAQNALPVHVDAIQIQQIVINLVRTGLESMRVLGPGRRRLRIATTSSSDGKAHLTIRHTGAADAGPPEIGMLDPFFATEAGGRAAGLRICHSIAEAHAGRLLIECPADGGALFELILPLSEPPHG